MDTFARCCLLWTDGVLKDHTEGYDIQGTTDDSKQSDIVGKENVLLFKAIFIKQFCVIFACFFFFPGAAHPGLVDKRTLQEQTALLLAVSCERLSCVQSLLEAGADPDICSKNKETPLCKGTAAKSVVCPTAQPFRQAQPLQLMYLCL